MLNTSKPFHRLFLKHSQTKCYETELTSQTRAAVVVFPTPGGPDSNAALNPEPSSLLPNLPNLAVSHRERETQ